MLFCDKQRQYSILNHHRTTRYEQQRRSMPKVDSKDLQKKQGNKKSQFISRKNPNLNNRKFHDNEYQQILLIHSIQKQKNDKKPTSQHPSKFHFQTQSKQSQHKYSFYILTIEEYKIMQENHSWCQQSDQLLKYLYQNLQIFNWTLIAKQISQRFKIYTNPDQCRNRYLEKYGPVTRVEWTPQQQKQLYRLHNQNGNKWSIVSQNLLGRNDNSVKNHFYSKLRKSLRTINKIAKLHLKKQFKQISDLVIYKLTQATDQSLKSNTEISKSIISMCYDLKNKLLQYQMDQKDIKDNLDYCSQKQLLNGLAEFNKIYKKKSKKQKISFLGSENLKKRRKLKKNKPLSSTSHMYADHNQSCQISQNINQKSKQQQQKNTLYKNLIQKNKIRSLANKQSTVAQRHRAEYFSSPRSQSQYSTHKKTINYFIKAPQHQQSICYQKKNIQLISNSSKALQKDHPSMNFFQYPSISQNSPNRNKTRIQDILKAQGILQNGFSGNENYFRRQNSMRSFSICSQSSNPDMFGEDLAFGTHFKQLSSMDNDSHFFKNNQIQ